MDAVRLAYLNNSESERDSSEESETETEQKVEKDHAAPQSVPSVFPTADVPLLDRTLGNLALEPQAPCNTEVLSSDSDDDSSSESVADSVRTVRSTAPSELSHLSPYEGFSTGKNQPVDEEILDNARRQFPLPESVSLLKIGTIRSIIDNVVVVEADRDSAPLDLDSFLLLSREKPLGRVFDVFGPVIRPLYSIRFPTAEHIPAEVVIGKETFVVPLDPELTAYVFLNDLRQYRGTDASWEDNKELPDELVEFSDDEAERQYRQHLQRRKRQHDHSERKPKPQTIRKPEQHHPPAAAAVPPQFPPWGMPHFPRPEMYNIPHSFMPPRPFGPMPQFPIFPPPGMRMPPPHFHQPGPFSSTGDGEGYRVPEARGQYPDTKAPLLPVETCKILPVDTVVPVVALPARSETMTLTENKPLLTNPKLLPAADVLFYNPKDDPTVNQSRPLFSARPFFR